MCEGSVDITQALVQNLPVTAKVRDRTEVNPCGICSRVALGQDFSPVTSAISCHSHSKNVLISRFIHTLCIFDAVYSEQLAASLTEKNKTYINICP